MRSLQPAIDPNARPTFLLDWELTMKCNLDCSYCPTDGPTPGHMKNVDHPSLEDCLETIDFMFSYVDLYMEEKLKWNRAVVLNVYGGESLFHPDIDKILQVVRDRHEAYKDKWPLTITCTTNGVVGSNLLSRVLDLVDEFTVSYHCESLPKQKALVRENLLLLKKSNKPVKCVVLMHGDEKHWPELLDLIEFCKHSNIKYLPRQLDGYVNSTYNQKQITWFKDLWYQKSLNKGKELQTQIIDSCQDDPMLAKVGRACCGGRLLCLDEKMKNPVFYISNNNFQGWNCSVNWFFLFIKQHTREIFTNKDCRMNFSGDVAPIGSLDDYQKLLDSTRSNLENKQMPIITCAKTTCLCGLCAPKSSDQGQFLDVMKNYVGDISVFKT